MPSHAVGLSASLLVSTGARPNWPPRRNACFSGPGAAPSDRGGVMQAHWFVSGTVPTPNPRCWYAHWSLGVPVRGQGLGASSLITASARPQGTKYPDEETGTPRPLPRGS